MTRYSEDTGFITISLGQYNKLMELNRDWMNSVWVIFPKQFLGNRITVSGIGGSGLATRLNYIRETYGM